MKRSDKKLRKVTFMKVEPGRKVGLILEGGGMRGAFTSGVLDCWLEKGLEFRDVYGVSAGACQACSYLCRQPGRGLRVWTDYIDDPRFCSVRSLITTGDLFGAELNYDLVPRRYDPLDNAAYSRGGGCLYAVVTNVKTGKAEYLPIRDMIQDVEIVRASASLPLISRMVKIGDDEYLDGGVSDSIPIRRSIADGHSRNVLVLTQAAGYRKSPNRAMGLVRLRYARYPKLVQTMQRRHITYNDTLDFIEKAVEEGRAFVIRPDIAPDVGRIEKDPEKLKRLHDIGFAVANREYGRLLRFLEESCAAPSS